MARTKNSKNNKEYKYKVFDETTQTYKFYITQSDIQDEYQIKRTALYYLIHNPDNIKTNYKIKVEKLPQPLPVYEKIIESHNNGYTEVYNLITY